MVQAKVRRIKTKHLHNLRDLGGYETSDGGVTAWEKLYRSDCPDRLEDSEWEKLAGLGIKTLVDIRSTYEINEAPIPVPEFFSYRKRPFFYEEPGADMKGEAGKKFLASLSIDYCVMCETSAMQIPKILAAILEGLEQGAVMFFCTAGKDRTGIIAAELLRLCGVSDEDIVADYSVTEIYNAEAIQQRIRSLPPEILAQISPETMKKAADSSPATMVRYLSWSRKYGFSERMDKLGFSIMAQSELKTLLLSGK